MPANGRFPLWQYPALNGARATSAEFVGFATLATREGRTVYVRNEGGFWRECAGPPAPPIDYAIFHPRRFNPDHPNADASGHVGQLPEVVIQQNGPTP